MDALVAVRFLRFGGIAAASLLTCAPMLLARRPRTPLRVLCISAFEYLARLNGRRLHRTERIALGCACDFGALRNDFYDQRELNRPSYRQLRCRLRQIAPRAATLRYIRELRQTERYRPACGPDGFLEPHAVVEYRTRVLEVSLSWLQAISLRSLEPRLFQALVALVGLVQLVDDLIDWKDDWACRRPTYVTAFLRQWAHPTSVGVTHIRFRANRFRHLIVAATGRRPELVPLMLAGGMVWLMAIGLMRIRFGE
jgi:hypothetical protein